MQSIEYSLNGKKYVAAAAGNAGAAIVKPTHSKAPKSVAQIEASNILGFDANLSKDHPVSAPP